MKVVRARTASGFDGFSLNYLLVSLLTPIRSRCNASICALLSSDAALSAEEVGEGGLSTKERTSIWVSLEAGALLV